MHLSRSCGMTATFPYREPVPTCRSGLSFRYFLARESVSTVWKALENRYGSLQRNEDFKTQEITGSTILFRSTWAGNPIFVQKKRSCPDDEVEWFHDLIGLKNSESR